MATQAFIIERENEVIEQLAAERNGGIGSPEATRQAIAECIEALDYERKYNGGMIGANRDCWGTLGVNASCLGAITRSAELREPCVQLSRLLGVHKGIHTEGIGQP
jgi:hypothetical protein